MTFEKVKDSDEAVGGEAMDHFLLRYKAVADLGAPSVVDINKPRYGFAHEDGWLYRRLPADADPNGKTEDRPIRLSGIIKTESPNI
jgi:hypothetical protein